ncbi:type 1 glutamine amidotransferase [Nocardioides sp. GY 10127]|uniref:type 1 glutamine amidotransferase n=1 Tax=Nocardioides sp. GY 10127 TaxID=2569762 RepID=UPI0010A85B9F|nr:type 1 glutamine amidotransferase [Nocardioides sp. GY 10127]TIC85664.1 type 1 glutamine amidotransferase [Nocardioides sp. GY 10127]
MTAPTEQRPGGTHAGASRPVVLVVRPDENDPPGMLGRWLVEAGCDLVECRTYADDALPADLEEVDALVVLGGSMGADDEDEHPWLVPLKALVREAAVTHVPTLGICLGHQVIASALGGRVVVNPQGRTMGLTPVAWTQEAESDALLGGLLADRAMHWNNDVVAELPAGGIRLASSPLGDVQAARHAPGVWGVQCHPEADADIVAGWPETEAVVPVVREALPELEISWRPAARRLADMAAQRHAARAGSPGSVPAEA